MNNNFKYEDDKFKLVPLNLPDNCKGSFLPMNESNIELFKNGCVSPINTLTSNFNVTKLNNLNDRLINSSIQNQILNSNFSQVKGLVECNNIIENFNSTNNVLIKTLITVKKANELFD
ncbi:MAG: hypothetical protein ACRC7R_07865 [Sarcina sp.]